MEPYPMTVQGDSFNHLQTTESHMELDIKCHIWELIFFLKDFILHSPGLTSNSRSSGLFKLLYFVLNYQNAFITKLSN